MLSLFEYAAHKSGGYQRGAKIGCQAERSNTCKPGKVELEFHGAGFLKVVGGEVVVDSFVKFEVTLVDLTALMHNELGTLEVHGVYPHQNH